MGNRQRKVIRAENNDPINFTCGECKQVHKFNEGYKCTNEEVIESGIQS